MASKKDLRCVSSLWKEYKKSKEHELRNRLALIYLPLVKYNAERIKSKLPESVELDDLISAGVFGLMGAIDAFDLSRSVLFETYCVPRIRGAILDELRTMDWVPRLVRSHISKYKKAMETLGNGNGHVPTLQEFADYLGVSVEDARKIETEATMPVAHICNEKRFVRGEEEKSDLRSKRFLSIDMLADKKALRPEDELSRGESLQAMISFLDDTEQIILTLYFRNDYTMKKIGEILGMCESRISQMCTAALHKVKDSLTL